MQLLSSEIKLATTAHLVIRRTMQYKQPQKLSELGRETGRTGTDNHTYAELAVVVASHSPLYRAEDLEIKSMKYDHLTRLSRARGGQICGFRPVINANLIVPVANPCNIHRPVRLW